MLSTPIRLRMPQQQQQPARRVDPQQQQSGSNEFQPRDAAWTNHSQMGDADAHPGRDVRVRALRAVSTARVSTREGQQAV